MVRALINIGLVIALLWVVGLIMFVMKIDEVQMPDQTSIQRADAFIVFTGGAHRTETGFALLQENSEAKLLISGVFETTTLDDLIETAQIPNSQISFYDKHCCIILDYKAKTTRGNVRSTLNWLNTARNLDNIIIVTSAYHVPRAKLLFEQINGSDSKTSIEFYPVRQKNEWHSPKYWGHVLNEFHKTIYTYAININVANH